MPADAAIPARGIDFFFYGTLLDADVRTLVAGAPLAGETARLADHATVPVGLGRFPMIVHWPGAVASGLLCRGATVAIAARLSFFESEGIDYDARRLRVLTAAGETAGAWVYMPTAKLRRGPGRWEFERWRRYEKVRFLRRTHESTLRIDRERLAAHWNRWQGRVADIGAGARR